MPATIYASPALEQVQHEATLNGGQAENGGPLPGEHNKNIKGALLNQANNILYIFYYYIPLFFPGGLKVSKGYPIQHFLSHSAVAVVYECMRT